MNTWIERINTSKWYRYTYVEISRSDSLVKDGTSNVPKNCKGTYPSHSAIRLRPYFFYLSGKPDKSQLSCCDVPTVQSNIPRLFSYTPSWSPDLQRYHSKVAHVHFPWHDFPQNAWVTFQSDESWLWEWSFRMSKDRCDWDLLI